MSSTNDANEKITAITDLMNDTNRLRFADDGAARSTRVDGAIGGACGARNGASGSMSCLACAS